MRKGQRVTTSILNTCIRLLREAEMTISEVATRLEMSKSWVGQVNRKLQIRNYGTAKAAFWVGEEFHDLRAETHNTS